MLLGCCGNALGMLGDALGCIGDALGCFGVLSENSGEPLGILGGWIRMH